MPRVLSINSPAFPDIFTSVKLSGTECINQLFSYNIILKTPDLDSASFFKQFGLKSPSASVDLTDWLGQSLTLSIELDGKDITFQERNNTFLQTFTKNIGKGTRHISGIIQAAQYLYDQGRSSYYQINIVPFIAPATLRSNYRIYQDQTPIDIIDSILTAYTGTVDKRLTLNNPNRYPKRDYQSQFGETDFQFFARICFEWGINFWFEHHADGHTLVLSDDVDGHLPLPSEAYQQINYYPPNHKTTEEYIHEFNVIAQMVSGAFASTDYNYAQPNADLLNSRHNSQPYPDAQKQGAATSVEQSQEDKQIAQTEHEVFEYAADVVQPQAGPNQQSNDPLGEQALRTQWNLERLQQQHLSATAVGYIRGLACGHTFELNHHPSALANTKWLINGSELLIIDVAEESQRSQNSLPSLLNQTNSIEQSFAKQLTQLIGHTDQKWHIHCATELIPARIPVRPAIIAKPKGCLQNALVVGEAEANAIYTDSFGRIKVQFYWDRYHQKDQNSSCWVRVNEPWAGNQMGAVFTPRIGQEVLIDYINNDPDLPICIGKVNNSDNMPPWALAQNQALSGFRSRELPEGNNHSGRSNHLVFDDSEGHIQTQLKSDHAHSQLSLGDITRVEDNEGRKDARGLGFELRTDDWGSARAAKGLYLSTFAREKADSTHMDAYEAQQLIEEAQNLVKQLSKLAQQHQAEPLSAVDPLNALSKVTASDLPKHPDASSGSNALMDNIMNPDGFNLNSLSQQIDEANALKSVLPNGLPNEVKAKATEQILKDLAKQEATPPIKPINPLSDPSTRFANNIGDLQLHYDAQLEQYKKAFKAFEQNPYDKAKEKLKELAKIGDKQEKMKTLLEDKGIKDIFKEMKANGKSYEQLQEETESFSPAGFSENVLLGAGEAGIALVTPKQTHQYSSEKHSITTGQDLNVTTGQSWLASIGNKLSFFVQQGIKVFSGKGKVEIQAHDNNVEIIADKTLKVISANDKVEIAAEKEILLTSGGAYIKLSGGNIYIHAPGTIEHKAASHPFSGPTSLNVQYDLPKGDLTGKSVFILSSHPKGKGVLYTQEPYKLFKNGDLVQQGLTDDKAAIIYDYEEHAQYQVELTNGYVFEIEAPNTLDDKKAILAQALTSMGYRNIDYQASDDLFYEHQSDTDVILSSFFKKDQSEQ